MAGILLRKGSMTFKEARRFPLHSFASTGAQPPLKGRVCGENALSKDSPAYYSVFRAGDGWAGVAGTGRRSVTNLLLPVPGKEEAVKRIRSLSGARGKNDRALARAAGEIRGFLDGKITGFKTRPLLDGIGGFRRKCLVAAASIPYGEVRTYAWVARRAGAPGAARAAGSAMAANPVPLIIPCHRVVRSDGTPGEYSGPGGRGMKKRLIRMEKAVLHGRSVKSVTQ